ncbi:MAG: ABC transporter permease subunit [Cyclobacteriaceae bacterium]|nr:ABC transporter permease subunit [Cyclobacteriaceae bacterium]
MVRLLEIEWLKLKNYKIFWILTGMYLLGLALVLSSGMFLMQFLKYKGADFDGIDPTILPLYDFPDVWQNVTYVATFFKVLLAFIVIISVTNEISYRTMRQNVIDGLSKWEFLQSKLYLILALSACSTLFLFLEGLLTGLVYSHVIGLQFIFAELEFLAAYFLEVFTFLSFAMLLGLLIKKSGFVIVLVFMYTLIFEPFLAVNMMHNPWIKEYSAWLAPYLPIRALNNLIQVPFQRYIFMEIQDYVAWKDVLIVLGWLIVFQLSIYKLLDKRDI